MKATIAWKHGHAFTSTYEGQTINIDGDKQEGPGPKSLLLSGLAGCSGIDVVDILEKMRVPFGRFFIEVETEQTEEHPKVFKDITVIYHIDVEPVNADKVKKAIELSLDKYCGVAAMLKKNSGISYKLEILQ
ncbi:OsmC family protein [Terrimonas ferruginea]|uniref:OsmC family protein n=1 Tax=Terrimonas ferruginea TaxID=249 RepID=UPI000426DC73|nr:OsmC family protein [Terrimonas ferruginea]